VRDGTLEWSKNAKGALSRLGVDEVPLAAYVFEGNWRSTL
jgi:hypothetical protein